MRVADLWIRQWVEAGIEVAFGIPGVHNMALFDALRQDGRIRVVVPRHELGAAYMADGYFRATGKYALVLTITGPGLTNALTGIAEADAESSGMIVVATVPRVRDFGQNHGVLHELPDQRILVEGLVKASGSVRRPEDAGRVMREILESRATGRPAPLYIEIPYDLLDAPVPDQASDGGDGPEGLPAASGGGDGGVIRRAGQPPDCPIFQAGEGEEEWLAFLAAKVRSWRNPLVVVGAEAAEAADLCRQLVQRWGVPALTTVPGKGIIAGDDPWHAGTTWTPGIDQSRLLEECDGILAIGTRWSLRGWHRETRPDADIVLVTGVPGDIRSGSALSAVVTGPLSVVLERILDGLPWEAAASRNTTQAERAHRARTVAARRADEVCPDLPQWLQAVRYALPGDAILAVDTTLVGIAMARYLPVLRPRTFLYPMHFGSLGFAVPAAIGAAVGGVGQAVAVTGDGSLMFTVQELSTALQEDLPLLILVFNNRAYGSVRHNQRQAYGRTAYVDLSCPDLEKLASAFSFTYQKVKWDELPSTLWKVFPLAARLLWEIDDAPVDTY
ncbi:MAG: thiamine pyrophosphate-binding protein [Alicyclobacillaceae bacterium]|nr:thiamine pyrophosphate-binding protein [Alicyclobacillaceae bacterium]